MLLHTEEKASKRLCPLIGRNCEVSHCESWEWVYKRIAQAEKEHRGLGIPSDCHVTHIKNNEYGRTNMGYCGRRESFTITV